VEERLQKLMAQAGLGSRRACEVLISEGRVSVNGRIVGLGDKADPQRDRILVDGQPLKLPEAPVYVALYKPRGVLSAVSSPDPRPTVRDLVDLPGHLYPVGRLDVDSEGLILLTSDGELANRLTHPRYGHEKEYRVLVARRPDEEQLETWRRGVVLEDGYRTAPAEIRLDGYFGKGTWLRVVLREGRKRQIRETGLQIGLPVVKIIRVRIGSLRLGTLKPREWRRLTEDEVAELKGKPVHKPKTSQAKPYSTAKKPWTKPGSPKSPPSSRGAPAKKQPYPPSTAPKRGSGKSRQHKG
jgi:23S rRNA pseudouridine2605 synthase